MALAFIAVFVLSLALLAAAAATGEAAIHRKERRE